MSPHSFNYIATGNKVLQWQNDNCYDSEYRCRVNMLFHARAPQQMSTMLWLYWSPSVWSPQLKLVQCAIGITGWCVCLERTGPSFTDYMDGNGLLVSWNGKCGQLPTFKDHRGSPIPKISPVWAHSYGGGQFEAWKPSAAVPGVQHFLSKHSQGTWQRPPSLPRLGLLLSLSFLSTGTGL